MKFCFWGNIGATLQGLTVGGGELQIALLAKSLALKGHDVVIIDPYAKESFTTNEGIKLINIPGWNKGIRGIRLFYKKIPSLYKLLKAQNADYYYVRLRSYLHLLSYFACKKVKGKFIVATASHFDLASFRERFNRYSSSKFNLFKYLSSDLPKDWAFNFLLKRADFLLVQHAGQKSNVKKAKGCVAVFYNIFDASNLPEKYNREENYYIHVGTLNVLKGSLNLFRLIKRLDKNVKIVVVGSPNDATSKKVFEHLLRFKNIDIKGRLPHKDTIQLIAGAKALINLSNFEGFPNIFLEAWGAGVPVISLIVNPGNVFEKYPLGVCCNGDLEQMKKYLEEGSLDNIQREPLKAYISEFHLLDTAADRFLKLLKDHS